MTTHRVRLLTKTTLALLLVVLRAASPASAQESNGVENSCLQINLSPMPVWAFSGGWTNNGYDLILADSGRKRLLRYEAENYLKTGRGSVNGYEFVLDLSPDIPPDKFWPSYLHPADYGFLLEIHEGYMVKISRDFKTILGRSRIVEAKNSQDEYLASVVQWAPAGQDKVVVFGDVSLRGGNWVSAFVELSMSDPTGFRFLDDEISQMSIYDDSRYFYYLGNPYVAATSEADLYIEMERAPTINSLDVGKTAMTELQWAGSAAVNRLALPPNKGLLDIEALYSTIAQSSIPVALLAWESWIFVVDRRIVEDGDGTETRWFLSSVGSGPGNEIQLPIFASEHLSVIAGERYWGLLNKGHVMGLHNQGIQQVTLIPAERIREVFEDASTADESQKLCTSILLKP